MPRNRLAQLLGELHAAGLRLSIEEAGLLGVEPADRISPAMREEIKLFRKDILEGLRLYGDRFLPMFAYGQSEQSEMMTCAAGRQSKELKGGVA